MPTRSRPDYVFMACTTASVSYRELLTQEELIDALLSGKVPENRRPHLRTLLEEGAETLIAGLVTQISQKAERGKILNNVQSIAKELEVHPRVQDWLKTL